MEHQPPSGQTCARPAANPAPTGYIIAAVRRVPGSSRLRTAAVQMDECAPGGYPAPAGDE